MELNEKIDALADVFDRDVGEIRPEVRLDEIGWDSMTMLGVIAMVKTRFNKKIAGAQMREFKTVQDILAIMD